MRGVEEGFGNLPETTAVEFEIVFFKVGFDGCEGGAGGLFVVGFLLRIAALVGVGHYGADGMIKR
jgi:hypothetical protein